MDWSQIRALFPAAERYTYLNTAAAPPISLLAAREGKRYYDEMAEHADVHAAIDVSDGLSLDLARLCDASGCGAVLDLGSIPVAPAAQELARQRGDSTALEHVLSDGEDFELILALAQQSAEDLVARQPVGAGLSRIGTFIDEPGLFARCEGDKREPLQARGYEHRFDA